jgi:hypothetical protein
MLRGCPPPGAFPGSRIGAQRRMPSSLLASNRPARSCWARRMCRCCSPMRKASTRSTARPTIHGISPAPPVAPRVAPPPPLPPGMSRSSSAPISAARCARPLTTAASSLTSLALDWCRCTGIRHRPRPTCQWRPTLRLSARWHATPPTSSCC